MHAVPIDFEQIHTICYCTESFELCFYFCLLFICCFSCCTWVKSILISNLKVSHWKTKDEEEGRVFTEDFALFALDVNRLVALLCHGLVYFIAVVAEFLIL